MQNVIEILQTHCKSLIFPVLKSDTNDDIWAKFKFPQTKKCWSGWTKAKIQSILMFDCFQSIFELLCVETLSRPDSTSGKSPNQFQRR